MRKLALIHGRILKAILLIVIASSMFSGAWLRLAAGPGGGPPSTQTARVPARSFGELRERETSSFEEWKAGTGYVKDGFYLEITKASQPVYYEESRCPYFLDQDDSDDLEGRNDCLRMGQSITGQGGHELLVRHPNDIGGSTYTIFDLTGQLRKTVSIELPAYGYFAPFKGVEGLALVTYDTAFTGMFPGRHDSPTPQVVLRYDRAQRKYVVAAEAMLGRGDAEDLPRLADTLNGKKGDGDAEKAIRQTITPLSSGMTHLDAQWTGASWLGILGYRVASLPYMLLIYNVLRQF